MLISFHVTAAAVARDPRWLLSEDESKQLARALHEANRFSPTRKIDPRFLAYGNLAYVATAIYGTRVVAMMMERAEARKQAQARPAGISAAPFQAGPTAPPPSDAAPNVPHPATARNPDGATGATTYRKVAAGLVDEATLAAAMQGLNIKT